MSKVEYNQRQLSSSFKKLDKESTSKLMDEAQLNYQEFMKNRKLISRFDPRRKEQLVKKTLSSSEYHKDYTRLNIFSTQNKQNMVRRIANLNFAKIFDQNLPKLV